MSITIDSNNSLSIKGTSKVSIEAGILIAGSGTRLPVTITADFSEVPQEYHETYYQAFVYQYRGTSVVYENKESIKSDSKYKKSNIDKIIELVTNPKNWILKKK
jgi:lipopolysaccharide export system protein LptA